MNKKANLYEALLYIIIGILIFFLLWKLIPLVWNMISPPECDNLADWKSVKELVVNLDEGDIDTLIFYNGKCKMVSFIPYNINYNKIKLEHERISGPAICLCNIDSEICKNQDCLELDINSINKEQFNTKDGEKTIYLEFTKADNILTINTGKEEKKTNGNLNGDVDSIILEYSIQYNVEEELIKAIIQKESNWDQKAIGYKLIPQGTGFVKDYTQPVSFGLMQITEDTANFMTCEKDFKENVRSNVDCGVKYLNHLIKNVPQKDYPKQVIAAYNGGLKALEESKGCSGLRVWECELNEGYAETRVYVPGVLTEYNSLKGSQPLL